jgi:hypothetical protein
MNVICLEIEWSKVGILRSRDFALSATSSPTISSAGFHEFQIVDDAFYLFLQNLFVLVETTTSLGSSADPVRYVTVWRQHGQQATLIHNDSDSSFICDCPDWVHV